MHSKDFVYLGSSVNTTNDVSHEIRRKITLDSRSYFGLSKQLSNIALSRNTKLSIYITLIMSVLMYGAETWTMSSTDEKALCVFERKVFRKIYGRIYDVGVWRIR